jgi:DNA-binding GntR family transcriptional regulator
LAGSLDGGARLVQADIAEQLGVSTTPVREAMRDLASEGLIRFEPYRGAIVYVPSLDEIREIEELRILLGSFAIRRTVERISDEELERAEAIESAMELEVDPLQWTELNRSFHATLEDGARSPRLSAVLNNLRDSAAIVVAISLRARPSQMKSGNRDHRELLDACRVRDPDRAAAVIERHFSGTLEAVERYLAGLEAASSPRV